MASNAREAAKKAAAAPPPAPGTDVATTRQQTREDVIRVKLKQMTPELARALPATLANDPDRWARIALTVIRTNPKLLGCTDASLLGALMVSTSLALEPGPLGLSYWVPFWNKNVGQDEVVFMIGYKGLINLARRSGNIADVVAREVYPSDEFNVEYGVVDKLHHKPNLDRDPEEPPKYFYSVARFVGEGHHIHVMNRDEIESFRKRSKAKDSGPWVTDWTAMAKKTVIRRASTWWPMTIELARAINADETIQRSLTVDAMHESMDTEVGYDEAGVRELEPARAGGQPPRPAPDAPEEKPAVVEGEVVERQIDRVRAAQRDAGAGDDVLGQAIADLGLGDANTWTPADGDALIAKITEAKK